MGQSMLPVSGGGGFDLEAGKSEKIYFFSADNSPGTNYASEVYNSYEIFPSWFKSCKKALIVYKRNNNSYTYLVGFLGETFTWEDSNAGTVTTTYSISSKGKLYMTNTCTSGINYAVSNNAPNICIIGLD